MNSMPQQLVAKVSGHSELLRPKLSCNEPVTIRENEAAIAEAAFRE